MNVFCFDTETTDLITNQTLPIEKRPYLIDFYGCLANLATGEIEHEFDSLIRAPVESDKGALKAHGLTMEMLKDAPIFSEVSGSILSLIQSGYRPLCHNASFDMEVVTNEFERLGQQITWPKRPLCTVEHTVHIKGYRLKLPDLHEFLFGTGFEGAHRAKTDAQATLRCAVELFKRGEL